MEWVFLVIGGLVGALLSQQGLAAPVIGAFTGFLLGMMLRQRDLLRRLEIRLAGFEARLNEGARDESAVSGTPKPRETASPAQPAVAPASSSLPGSPGLPNSPNSPAASATPGSAMPRAHGGERETSSRSTQETPSRQPGTDIFQLALRWLLSGNVPAKVGVVVSFFGVAFLLKFAVDAGYVSFSPALRVIAVLLFAAVLLWLGWRFRERQRAYAMALFGGSIGLMYLAFFAAFRLYQLVPAMLAFLLLAMVAAFSVWLAIRERAFVLAGLGVTGGFLAPLLVSTGSGSHVALFSYYLLINIGIAAVAFFQHWRLLNLIGFAFTFIIGLAWGAEYYETRYFVSVEPFLLAHFLLYVLVAVLSAMRQPFHFKGYVDSALVFGLPLVVFPLQSGLVDDFERGMAWSSLGLGVFYCTTWFALRRVYAAELKLLLQAFLALGVAFLTLAVPLWFDAPWVSGTWALEGVGMIWIGLRQRRELTRWAGIGMLLLALPALLLQLDSFDTVQLLLNARFIGLAMIAIPALFAARLHEVAINGGDSSSSVQEARGVAGPSAALVDLLAWGGLLLWLIAAVAEVSEYATHLRAAFWYIFAASATGAAITLLAWKTQSGIFRRLALGVGALVPLLAVVSLHRLAHPLAELGWLAWPLAYGFLFLLRKLALADDDNEMAYIDSIMLWTALLLVPMEFHWLAGEYLPNRLWNEEIALASAAGLLLVLARLPNAGNRAYEKFGLKPAMVVTLLMLLGVGFDITGGQQPLPYMPVLNGLAATSGLVLFAVWQLFRSLFARNKELLAAFAAVALLAVTQEIARATHQLAEVRYDFGAMLASDVFQAAVSVTWSVIGLAAMGYGTRRLHRHVWFAGAILMSCVVLKLFAIDLGNTGTVARIVSFVGVGILLLVVGYLAPVPARTGRKEA